MQKPAPEVFDFQPGCSEELHWPSLTTWLPATCAVLRSRREAQRPVPAGRQGDKETVELC